MRRNMRWRFGAGWLGVCVLVVVYLFATDSTAEFWKWAVKWAFLHEREYPLYLFTRSLGPLLVRDGWLVALALVGVWFSLRNPEARRDDRVLLLSLLLAFVSFAVQRGAYPYSLLPFVGLCAPLAARAWDKISAALAARSWLGIGRARTASAVALLLLGVHCAARLLTEPHNAYQQRTLLALGRLTGPDDPVYDNSGQATARPHVHFFYATDKHMRERFASVLANEVPRRLEQTGCMVVFKDLRFKGLPDSLRRFIAERYQPYDGDLWFWGVSLASSGELVVPRTDRYFVEPAGASVELDGKRIGTEPILLSTGRHQYRSEGAAKLLWLPRDGRRWKPDPTAVPRFSRLF
jgi:hypothetical protein